MTKYLMPVCIARWRPHHRHACAVTTETLPGLLAIAPGPFFPPRPALSNLTAALQDRNPEHCWAAYNPIHPNHVAIMTYAPAR